MQLNDRELIARTLQAEAGNQGLGGMLAVGSVIKNRMGSGQSFRDIILAPAQFSAWNKFTGAAGGEQGQDMSKVKPSEDAYAAADALISGNIADITGGATHYYNPNISNPAWGASAGGDWTKIGSHVFGKAGDFRTGAKDMIGAQAPQQMAQQEKPRGLLGGMIDRDFADQLYMAALAGSPNAQRFQPLIQQVATGQQARRAQKGRNATAEYLDKIGQTDLGDLVRAGGIDGASALSIATSRPKVSEAENKIQRLMETGLDRETAIAIADGRVVVSRDPVTQRVTLVDKGTFKTIGQAPDAVADEVEPEPSAEDRFKDLPVSKAGGLAGWGANMANLVTDALGAGQQFPNIGEAQAAMNDLSKRTILMLDADFAGKPSNFTREIVGDLTVKPAEVFQGSTQSYQKAVNMISALEEAISGAKAAITNPEKYSPQKVREAEGGLPKLQGLLDDYTSLKNAFERKGLASQRAAGGQPTVVQTDQDRALIEKYRNPNYYRDNMLPSPN